MWIIWTDSYLSFIHSSQTTEIIYSVWVLGHSEQVNICFFCLFSCKTLMVISCLWDSEHYSPAPFIHYHHPHIIIHTVYVIILQSYVLLYSIFPSKHHHWLMIYICYTVAIHTVPSVSAHTWSLSYKSYQNTLLQSIIYHPHVFSEEDKHCDWLSAHHLSNAPSENMRMLQNLYTNLQNNYIKRKD